MRCSRRCVAAADDARSRSKSRSAARLEPTGWGIQRVHRLDRGRHRCRPLDGVAQHPTDHGIVINRVGFMTGTEVEHPPFAAPETATAAEHFATAEARYENEFV